jgi:hypothetical protein
MSNFEIENYINESKKINNKLKEWEKVIELLKAK